MRNRRHRNPGRFRNVMNSRLRHRSSPSGRDGMQHEHTGWPSVRHRHRRAATQARGRARRSVLPARLARILTGGIRPGFRSPPAGVFKNGTNITSSLTVKADKDAGADRILDYAAKRPEGPPMSAGGGEAVHG